MVERITFENLVGWTEMHQLGDWAGPILPCLRGKATIKQLEEQYRKSNRKMPASEYNFVSCGKSVTHALRGTHGHPTTLDHSEW